MTEATRKPENGMLFGRQVHDVGRCPACGMEGQLDGACELIDLPEGMSHRERWQCDHCPCRWWEEFAHVAAVVERENMS